MNSARAARLRVLVNSEAWKDVVSVMNEEARAILQSALNADTEAEASRLILDARVANKLVRDFTVAVETIAQSGE